LTDRYTTERASDPVVPPAPSTIDLHTHTRRSDGILEPADVVAAAVAVGVRMLSITDHDTLAGYHELQAVGSLPKGLEFIPGVEINAVVGAGDGLWESELHILGLGMDPDDAAFEAQLAAQRGQRRLRFERIRARLRQIGMPIDAALDGQGLRDDDALGRPMVARALVATGHADSIEDAFQRWLGRDMPAYVPRDGLGPAQAIAAIRAAGGLPVLAHLGEAAERIGTVRELVERGLGGLEVYHRAFDQAMVDSVKSVAEELRLVPTGGSDYHGDLGPYAEAHATLWVPPEVADAVHQALTEAHWTTR
jgi:predicted metal-dependent phosphoesterase TrpH